MLIIQFLTYYRNKAEISFLLPKLKFLSYCCSSIVCRVRTIPIVLMHLVLELPLYVICK